MKREDTAKKIVPFPGSADKLVNDGLKLLKKGDKHDSLRQFLEALQHEPGHEEASYGLLLAYADTGKFQEGKQLAEKMMQEAIGDYFEVLQVYVSILAQLGEYEHIVTMLEAVLAEQPFPARMAEQFYELLELSRHMSETKAEPMPTEELEPVLEEQLASWENTFWHGGSEQKLKTIHDMRTRQPQEVLPLLKKLLGNEQASPLLQSFMLFLLKDWKVEDSVWVEKLGRKGEFSPATLRPVKDSTSYIKSSQWLEKALGHDNPVLMHHALELLKEILLFYYPFPPSMQIEPLTAVLHYEAARQSGIHTDVSHITQQYDVSDDQFCQVLQDYEKIKPTLSDI
ncbi:hypothetical protein SAMN05192534_104132 [Alteribacillus persepolensis]|uniref:Uncharacterized protein n=1 Tax=Alteribacillus persepolensis TaxID=568899 RepID=A0A1G8BR28_9BACI|nr:hypothetical protein [Alteribacillus persepolensis]SDH35523.1 hypothetical protein SAMN05192534_104132 [Alteribacillus persepolensis]